SFAGSYLFRWVDRRIDRLKTDHDVGQGKIRIKLNGLMQVLHCLRTVEVLQLDQAIHKQLARRGGFCCDGEIPLLVASSGFCHSNGAEAHDKQSDPEEISRHGSSPHPKNEHLPGQLGRWRENNPNFKSYKVTEVIQDTAKAKTNWV